MSGLGLIRRVTSETFLLARSWVHTTSSVLRWRQKRNPKNAAEIQLPTFTWPHMVGRGMRLSEEVTEYSIEPIQVIKTGGRGVHGRTEALKQGGGKRVYWHNVDKVRIGPDEPSPKEEIVLEMLECGTKSNHIALVGQGEKRRYIFATENMQTGMLLKSHNTIPDVLVRPVEGDCHPVGAFPTNTHVCCVERVPYRGSKVANGAGTTCVITGRSNGKVLLKMPSKREMMVDENCLAVAGRGGNRERKNRVLGKAGAARWLGIRPSSGWRKKKTGVHGRKVHPARSALDYTVKEKVPQINMKPYTFAGRNPFDEFIPQ